MNSVQMNSVQRMDPAASILQWEAYGSRVPPVLASRHPRRKNT